MKEYQFCFVSADDFSAITSDNTQIEILSDSESPMNLKLILFIQLRHWKG